MNLQTISKAIAGAVATALVAYAARHNVVLGADVSGAISVLLSAFIGFVVVYVAPKNQ